MTRPHENDCLRAYRRQGLGDGRWDVMELDGGPLTEAEAKLAAQAPAMARLLLKLEGGDTEDGPACFSCVSDWDDDAEKLEHADDCEWLSVMRAAGVVP